MAASAKGTRSSDKKTRRIELHLIVRTHLTPDATKWSQDKIIEELNMLTHLRLDRLNIGQIDNLELVSAALTNLYLQHNMIVKMENLETLTQLKVLVLSHNQISRIEGLTMNSRLGFLDLSYNQIVDIDMDEFPQNLVILNLEGNKCTKHADHRGRIIQDLPRLRTLDTCDVTDTERIEAGYVVSDESAESGSDDDEADTGTDDVAATSADDKAQQQTAVQRAVDHAFNEATAKMLMRSQARMEKLFGKHKDKMEELDDFRCSHNLSITPRITARVQPGTETTSGGGGSHVTGT